MNKEKYYTPTIEEFYVGFKYEIFDTVKWNTESLKLEDLIKGSTELGSYLNSALGCNFIRVKCLDKEDIESLEFEFTSQNIINELIRYDHKYKQYHIITYNNKLSIYHTPVIEEQQFELCIFNGIIKSKSELIKLFKQLNV